ALKPSAGQAELVPVHVSATSHSSAAARQIVPTLPAGCWHVTFVPSQRSRVQGLVSAVQAVPLVFFVSAGQVVLAPVHSSSRSHSPAAARQTAPAFPAGCWHVALVPPH